MHNVLQTKCNQAAADRTTAKADVILYTETLLEKMLVICVVNWIRSQGVSAVLWSKRATNI